MLDMVYKLGPDVSWQDMGKDQPAVILYISTGQLFTCNLTTRMFLEALDGSKTLAAVVDALYEQFDVERDKLQEDLEALATRLLEAKLIESCE